MKRSPALYFAKIYKQIIIKKKVFGLNYKKQKQT